LDIDEGKNTVKKENEGTRKLLKGFKMANIKIHLLSDDLRKLYSKAKYIDLFDIGILSIHSANKIDADMNAIFKKGAKVHVESADMLVPLSKDQRAEFRKKIIEKTEKANW
jgi:hypothetical protein